MNYFKDKLKDYRKKNNLTQEELAQTLHVSRQAVSKWETGSSYPNIEILHDISKLMNISLDELISNEEITSETIQNFNKQRKNQLHIIILFLGLFLSLCSGIIALFLTSNSNYSSDIPNSLKIELSNYEIMGLIFSFSDDVPTEEKILNKEYAGICAHFATDITTKYAASYNATEYKLSASDSYTKHEASIYYLNNIDSSKLTFWEVYYNLEAEEYFFNKANISPIYIKETGYIEVNHHIQGRNSINSQSTNNDCIYDFNFHIKAIKPLINYTIIEYNINGDIICQTKYENYEAQHTLSNETVKLQVQEYYGTNNNGVVYYGGVILDYDSLKHGYLYLTKYTNEFGFCNRHMTINYPN